MGSSGSGDSCDSGADCLLGADDDGPADDDGGADCFGCLSIALQERCVQHQPILVDRGWLFLFQCMRLQLPNRCTQATVYTNYNALLPLRF